MTKAPPSQLCTPTETPNEPAKPFPLFVGRANSGLGLQSFAWSDRKLCVSEDHRPPTSTASTTNRARARRRPTNSGYRRSFRRLAAINATPSLRSAPALADPSPLRALTNVVSTASWEPPCSGKQTIYHHLQSSGVSRIFQIKIEIAHQNVGGNSSTCLPTDPRRDTLHRKSPSGQYPSSSARCAVMAMSIEEVATPAGTHGKRKRQLETTEQEHSEQVRIQIGDAARWARSQCQTAPWARL